MYEQGLLKEAEGLGTKVLDRRRVAQGPSHRSTGDAMYTLACIWHKQRNWDQAEQPMAEAAELYEEALGAENQETQNAFEFLVE